jgi:hypothetical protein
LQPGPLLTRFSEKKLTYQVGHNPMRGSILWKMVRKDDQVIISHMVAVI